MGLVSAAVESSAKANNAVARQLAALEHQIAHNGQPMDCDKVRPSSPEEDDADPEVRVAIGKATLHSAHVTWMGNTLGASSAASLGGGAEGHSNSGGDGILGGGRPGGTGGGGTGGVGGGRIVSEGTQKHQLKMYFPRFDGTLPLIWKDKCLDYFWLFNVNPSLWLILCTLHMDGNAALWLKAYRLCHEISTWTTLMLAVEEKFGADDHRRYMNQLLALKQRGTVEEYQMQFEELSYQIAIQNPHYDEQFYVSQFIKGLKSEIRASVESQVPDSVERAILLALV
jgi:hypothetical protein